MGEFVGIIIARIRGRCKKIRKKNAGGGFLPFGILFILLLSTRKCVRDASLLRPKQAIRILPSTRKCVRDASVKCTHYLRSYTDYFVYLNLFECIANCWMTDLPPLSRFRDGKSPHNAMRTIRKSAVHLRFALLFCFQRIFYDFFNSDNRNILRSIIVRVTFKSAFRTVEFRL